MPARHQPQVGRKVLPSGLCIVPSATLYSSLHRPSGLLLWFFVLCQERQGQQPQSRVGAGGEWQVVQGPGNPIIAAEARDNEGTQRPHKPHTPEFPVLTRGCSAFTWTYRVS